MPLAPLARSHAQCVALLLAVACKNASPLPAATPQAPPACPSGEVCIYAWPNQPCTCQAVAPARATYALPLNGIPGAYCFHGTQDFDPTQTHAFRNTFFAIDLASPLDGPPSEVIAARAGTVVRVHEGCVDPGVSRGHADKCGNGFGNWVVLDHRDGEGSFYAHLAKVTVAEGQAVQLGQALGTEGITGAAGERHVHFSVHRIDSPPDIDGIGWPSIPYRLTYRPARGGSPVIIPIEAFPCSRSSSRPIAWSK